MIFTKLKGSFERLTTKANPHAVIILCHPKSGSNAIAHLLAELCGLSKTLDIPELWYPNIANFMQGKIDFSSFVKIHPKPFSRDLIKEPSLSLIFDQVKTVFPAAKYVFINRDPRDNIRSILNRVGVPGNLQHFAAEEWKLPTGWKEIFNPAILQIKYTHYIDILASQWNLITNVVVEHPNEMTMIRYEDFVADKAEAITTLAGQLELSTKNDISDKLDILYHPRGKDRDLPWELFFGTENLMRIEEICGSKMKKFEYLPSQENACG